MTATRPWRARAKGAPGVGRASVSAFEHVFHASVRGHETPLDDPLEALRRRVLRFSLGVLAGAMPLISVMLIGSAFATGDLDRRTFVLSSSVLAYPLLWSVSGRLGFRRTAIALLALLASTAGLLASRGGLTVGTGPST